MSASGIQKSGLQGILSPRSRRSDLIPVTLVSALSLVLHLIAIRGFGLFRDELYYIACSDHLAWGFVDQPPLSILVLKLVRFLFGDSPAPLRLLPALGGAAFVFLTGLMARELGGKRLAIIMGTSLDPQESLADLGPFFETVVLAGTKRCEYCMPYENNRAIFLCRRARFSMKEIWTREKNFI
jgi:hypothetical protein